LIAGPTASGKTALSIRLAKELNGHVVNADSMQIYRDLRILSARPTEAEEASAPHHLFGHVASDTPYSVMTWLEEFEALLKKARATKTPLIVVGGTGLYSKSLLEGISLLPDIPENVRDYWRTRALEVPSKVLHEELCQRDTDMAQRLNPADTQRIVRALEVVEGTGRSLAIWQNERSVPLLDEAETIRVVLAPDRKVLHERIHQRFDLMVEQGAVEEARRLWAQGLDSNLQVMKAIGVKQLAEADLGLTSMEWGIEKSKTETRRYAKRQATFFRGQLGSWPELDPLDAGQMNCFMEKVSAAFKGV